MTIQLAKKQNISCKLINKKDYTIILKETSELLSINTFIDDYYNDLDSEVLDALDNAEHATKENKYSDQMQLFNNHNIYVQQKNVDHNSNIKDLRPKLNDRIDQIKGNQIQQNNRVMCHIVDNTKPRT